MSTQSLLTPEIEEQLNYPTYWSKPYTEWGSVADWDLFYINEMPSTTRGEAHKTLSRELKVLLKCLEEGSCAWNKASAIKTLLKQRKNIVISAIWKEYQESLLKTTAENKINKTINKRKMENIARTATSATAEACSISDGCETAKRRRKVHECSHINNDRESNLNNIMEISLDYDIDFDNSELDNIGSDPNVEPELSESIAVQERFKKYPEQGSLNDEWILPSGRSIHEIIRGPRSLHKSHPSCLGIIRVGSKIRMPDWIEEVDWNYLNSSIDYPHCKLSPETENLITKLLETNSLNEYEECLYDKFDRKNNKEMTFVTDVLLWFAKNVFNPASAFHSINKNEALLGSLMIHPMLQYLTNTTDHVVYVPGEIYLKASANQRFLRRNLKPEDDKPKGMKVDGTFQSSGEKGLEIGMVELSGGYLTSDLPRYLKDHVKGYWGCRDIFNDIVNKYNHGDFKILRRLRTWFFHIHGLEVQIWGMDLPVSKAYRMFLIGVFRLPISWDDHHELVYALKVLWNLGRGLDDTLMVLEELKKSHRRNTALHSQPSALKSYLGDSKSSPQKPTGKKSRTINPLMHYDYDDSDYDDPPSPSPSGRSY